MPTWGDEVLFLCAQHAHESCHLSPPSPDTTPDPTDAGAMLFSDEVKARDRDGGQAMGREAEDGEKEVECGYIGCGIGIMHAEIGHASDATEYFMSVHARSMPLGRRGIAEGGPTVMADYEDEEVMEASIYPGVLGCGEARSANLTASIPGEVPLSTAYIASLPLSSPSSTRQHTAMSRLAFASDLAFSQFQYQHPADPDDPYFVHPTAYLQSQQPVAVDPYSKRPSPSDDCFISFPEYNQTTDPVAPYTLPDELWYQPTDFHSQTPSSFLPTSFSTPLSASSSPSQSSTPPLDTSSSSSSTSSYPYDVPTPAQTPIQPSILQSPYTPQSYSALYARSHAPAPLDLAKSSPSPSVNTSVNGNVNSARRPPGACARCKRLKVRLFSRRLAQNGDSCAGAILQMKCIFPDRATSERCVRCEAGGHGCVVEGRKARTPQRESILRQIRATDASITSHLSRLHPPPSSAASRTPLVLHPSRLASCLDPETRRSCGEALGRLEKNYSSSGKGYGGKEGKGFDVRLLELEEEWSEDDETKTTKLMEEATDREAAVREARLHSLPDRTAPVGFLASCSLEVGQRRHRLGKGRGYGMGAGKFGVESDEWELELGIGIASGTYFRPGPAADLNLRRIIIEREALPEILLSGLVSAEEAKALFAIYFEKLNPFLSLLDETIHTPAAVLRRCPFLFTAVCAIASRFYTARPSLYPLALHFAKAAAASAFIEGWKCVEMAQAYLIMAAYAGGSSAAARWEEERGDFYVSVAARLVVELNLNKPSRVESKKPMDERREREMLNRRRTWMICCIMDYSSSMQVGKRPMVREDEIIRNSARWCSASNFQHPFDAHLPAIIELLRIMNAFVDAVAEVDRYHGASRLDALASVIDVFARKLSASSLEKAGMTSGGVNLHEENEMADELRMGMVTYLLHYCRLIVFSHGLQNELKGCDVSSSDGSIAGAESLYLERSMEAAFALMDVWTRRLIPTGLVKYAPEFFFVATGFAGAFLIKLLHPRLARTICDQQRAKVHAVASSIVHTLASDEVAIDGQHAPKSYSVFLSGLLDDVTALWQQPQVEGQP
ncbi:hypothetical protein EW146_g528 [Bondarzewia mesenterica]|uniref:Xylanolytic transcriptional activator regulatory domain-containing protein n=1 Tax=Bondarzewia mesenterica TaxID=1095465 RepID=A0A4S4M900_9AGAM|nr:hypothetical protein EW146_g528 [Bondarzewia mesenterica]